MGERPGLLAAVLGLALAGAPAAARAQAPPPPPAPRGYPAVVAHRVPGSVLTDVVVDGDRLTARAGDGPLELVAGSPFYRLDGRVGQLANPPFLDDAGFWIPTELLARLAPGWDAGDDAHARAASGSAASGGAPGGGSTAERGRPSSAHGGPFRVVIDPGHGGKDPGAHGPRGTLEKNVALAVARRLKKKLDGVPWIQASLTRDSDVFLPLARRSKIAVQRDADLFLSIHCNSERGSSARGFETYFLSPARTDQAR
ncbi:MAG TPA: N-acetylmuramoyl-L-alanine amidase, partial [Gemmatimonadota bacterium]|nr:N-acetylmuramoyl-L-alanine amidase [Gemmatimonadota bacterium]